MTADRPVRSLADTAGPTPETIRAHELVGLRARVVAADNADLVGVAGRVVDETTNTLRSRQAPSRRANWRIGRASKNSFASTSAGPSGTPSSAGLQRASGTASACLARRLGLVSTNQTSSASRKPGTRAPARSASALRAPRPGPSSTHSARRGLPMPIQTCAAHSPSSSPNIWLTSGPVTKSRPSGSRVM